MELTLRALRSAIRGPFSVEFPIARCSVITGASGAGKSLLLRMIADLDPNEGEVFLDGVERNSMSAPQWRRRVTYVAAESGWWTDIVGDHMADRSAAVEMAPTLGLDPNLLGAPVAQLSTGERQRLALIRAIVEKPLFLLLDEPTSALDQETKSLVENLFRRLTEQGLGLIVVSHDAEQVRRIADRHLVMSAGALTEVAA